MIKNKASEGITTRGKINEDLKKYPEIEKEYDKLFDQFYDGLRKLGLKYSKDINKKNLSAFIVINKLSLLFYGLYGDEISFKSLDNIKSNIHLIISNKLREDIVKKASKWK